MSRYIDDEQNIRGGPVVRDFVLAALIMTVTLMAGCPYYNVWQQGLQGQAELARAQQNRQIAVQEAQAKMESAHLFAEAEVERAKGVAQANRIIGQSLKGNEGYLRYLWINSLNGEKEKTVVYIPTEANLPILEAGMRPTPNARTSNDD